MATRGQTHNKRAREMALREKRERKQAKKDDRAAGITSAHESFGEADGEAPAGEETETAPEPIE